METLLGRACVILNSLQLVSMCPSVARFLLAQQLRVKS
jgi:hypothetical protein